jgi:hypothetical protein
MKKILLFLLMAFFLSPVFSAVNAASFIFDRNTYSVSTGQTFQVQINIDVGEDQVNGADAYINYDSSFLSVENISAGSFFTTVINDVNTPGKVYIAGLVDDPASSKTGSGTLATITFKGLKDGTANLTLDCNNSKIVKNDANATNILQCSSSDKAVVRVGSGNSTPSDSNNSSNTSSNNQPTTLPKSGVFDNLINLGIPGAILFLIGGGLKLLILR